LKGREGWLKTALLQW